MLIASTRLPENPYCIESALRLQAYVKRTPPHRYDGQRLARRIRAFINHPRWDVRNVGVKLAGELALKSLRDVLIQRATDRRPAKWTHRLLGGDFHDPGFVRRNAVSSLHQLGTPDDETLDAFEFALLDPYYEVRTEAAKVFDSLGASLDSDRCRSVVAQLSTRVLTEKNFEVARAAVLALGSIAKEESVVELYRKLHYHRNWRVRDAIVTGYARLFERGIIKEAGRLLALLDDVLTTSEGFTPRFVLKENLVGLQRRLLSSRDDASPRAASPVLEEAMAPSVLQPKKQVSGQAPTESEAMA
jgi:hypothetical protein